MKKIHSLLALAGLTVGLILCQGCVLLLAGGAAAGGYSYVSNTLVSTRDISLDRAWHAANGALADLQIPVTLSSKDGTAGRLEGRTASDQKVIIELHAQTDRVTKIEVSAGVFDTQANRATAQLIYDKMAARF